MTEQRPKKKQVKKSIPVDLEKAEEMQPEEGSLLVPLIKTRGQLEQEAYLAQREAFVQQQREEKQREAERYSRYVRWGLFGTVLGSVAFLGYWFKFKNTQDVEPAAEFIASAL